MKTSRSQPLPAQSQQQFTLPDDVGPLTPTGSLPWTKFLLLVEGCSMPSGWHHAVFHFPLKRIWQRKPVPQPWAATEPRTQKLGLRPRPGLSAVKLTHGTPCSATERKPSWPFSYGAEVGSQWVNAPQSPAGSARNGGSSQRMLRRMTGRDKEGSLAFLSVEYFSKEGRGASLSPISSVLTLSSRELRAIKMMRAFKIIYKWVKPLMVSWWLDKLKVIFIFLFLTPPNPASPLTVSPLHEPTILMEQHLTKEFLKATAVMTCKKSPVPLWCFHQNQLLASL